MKNKNKKLKDVLIYKGKRYAIMTADISESWPHYEVKDVEGEIENVANVSVFLTVRAIRMEKQRHIILPRFGK